MYDELDMILSKDSDKCFFRGLPDWIPEISTFQNNFWDVYQEPHSYHKDEVI